MHEQRNSHEREETDDPCGSQSAAVSASLLQTAATIAGISIALLGVLKALPGVYVQNYEILPAVPEVLGFVSFTTLVSCAVSLTKLGMKESKWGKYLIRLSIVMLHVAIALLAVALLLYLYPRLGQGVNDFCVAIGEFFKSIGSFFVSLGGKFSPTPGGFGKL